MDRRRILIGLASGIGAAFLPWHGAQAKGANLKGYLRTNWSRDPYSIGAYSYVAKGHRQSDRIALGAPIENKVYFAGEAVHPSQNSTVHAAYESGVMVAQDVAADTKGTIAVIGAGISGLAVAKHLSDAGRSVTVFEARNRIGGRIWTSDALGTPLDLGASWIHGTRRNPLTKLARKAKAQTVPTDLTHITRGAEGRIIADADTPDWLDKVSNFQHEAGADRSEINLTVFNEEPEYGGEQVVFPNGYSSILAALSGTYDVRLSEVVSAISYGDRRVGIVSNRQEDRFDTVVVTVPLGVLKAHAVTFIPELPKDKKNAIKNLGMGTLDKLYLRYDRPFWDKDVTWIATPENGLPQGQFNEWLNLYKYLGEPIIMAFNGGPPALNLSRLPDEKLVALAQQALKSAYF